MKMMTIRDFRARPAQMRRDLIREGEAVLTTNGKPVALLLAVGEDSLDDTLRMVRRGRAQQALQTIRQHSREKGLDRLSMGDIDAIIAKTRKTKTEAKR